MVSAPSLARRLWDQCGPANNNLSGVESACPGCYNELSLGTLMSFIHSQTATFVNW